MAKYVNVDLLKHLLHEVHGMEEVLACPRFADHDVEGINMMIDSVKNFSDKELFPYLVDMDRHGVKFDDGKITVHPQIINMMNVMGENGYICSHFDYEEGGSQMPHMAGMASSHIMLAANNTAVGYMGLTAGAAGLIRSFGSKDLFDTYVPTMMSGKWGGTMALTEPQAGSSLSDIVTSASDNGDGTYSIKGHKIFISSGDYEGMENIIHLVLARIEGAPAGTKGISLFVVPKNRITDSGLEWNDVTTAGEYEKMGQKGYVTTHLVFGDNSDCRGFLVGEANKGLKYMFQMMNGARLEVGNTAASIAAAAYEASLQYAKERPQGRKLDGSGGKNLNAPQTLIINHPDVRRMLMLQRAVVGGSISILTLAAKFLDLSHHAESAEDREKYDLLTEILMPIVKTYPSEMGITSISNGMQVLGGCGFTKDFPLEQYYRDVRICAIYEGTTGIQSLDLLGRKMTMQNGKAIQLLTELMKSTIGDAMTFDELKPYAAKLGDQMKEAQKVIMHLMGFAMKGQFERFLADASVFMEYFSTITIAWQWLEMATAAKRAMVTGNGQHSEEFYNAQIHTMRFYYKYELSKTLGLQETLLSDEVLTIVEEGKVEEAFA